MHLAQLQTPILTTESTGHPRIDRPTQDRGLVMLGVLWSLVRAALDPHPNTVKPSYNEPGFNEYPVLTKSYRPTN